MMKRIIQALARWSWVAWVLFALSWFAIIGAWGLDPGPPTRILSVRVLTPVVHLGDIARFEYEVSRKQTCAAVNQGYWLDRLGEEVVKKRPIVAGGYGPVGDNNMLVAVPVPPLLTGYLCYRTVTRHNCEGRVYTTNSPLGCVEVVD